VRFLPLTDDRGCRNAAIVCLMADSGLRLSEVAGLDVDLVDMGEGQLRVLGKGRREAWVPFGAFTAKVLRRYLQHFRPHIANGTSALFVNQFGGRLGVEGIKSMIQRLRDESGISRLHPHLLRHTAATRLLANGCDLHTVQRVLRHKNVTTTTGICTCSTATCGRRCERSARWTD
jgi:site-specific recombinase XerD